MSKPKDVFYISKKNSSTKIVKIKSLALTTSIAISGIIASGSVTPASAFSIFFGEDISAGSNNSATSIKNSIDAEKSFLLNLNSPNAPESFEGITTGISATTALPNIGASISTTSPSSGVSNTPLNGRFAISGSNYYEVGSTTIGGVKTTTTVTFANPIAAVGFYATDLENQEGITLQLNDAANTLIGVQRTAAVSTNGSALYYGLIAQNLGETFTSVTFSLAPVTLDKENDRFGLDNLTFATLAQVNSAATAVPEPLTIIGTLIGGSAALRMKKKLKSSTKA